MPASRYFNVWVSVISAFKPLDTGQLFPAASPEHGEAAAWAAAMLGRPSIRRCNLAVLGLWTNVRGRLNAIDFDRSFQRRCWWSGWPRRAWAQNGLQRFEKELKPQLELKSFTYATGTAARQLGLRAERRGGGDAGQRRRPATRRARSRSRRSTVDELDFDRLKKDAKDDEAPRFAKLKFEGMTGDDEMFTALAPYGVPNVPVDIALDYRIDGKAKVLTSRRWRSTCAARPRSRWRW